MFLPYVNEIPKTEYVPDFALVVGNPSRQIGWVTRLGHMLTFNDEGLAKCPETGEAYKLKDDKVTTL